MIVIAAFCGPAMGAAPQVGDKAPAIKVAKWITSKPASLPGEKKNDKHVYLVEFWATWCPPCLKSIPHLAKIHTKYKKNGLVIISISNEEPETIAAFIDKKMKMPYAVGSDDDMATTIAWGENMAIPNAFIVSGDGIILWQGHPLSDAMEKTIEQALAGKFDIETAKTEALASRKFEQLMAELMPAVEAKDKDKVFDLLDRMIALRPLSLHPYLIKREQMREFGMAEQIPQWEETTFTALKDSLTAMRDLATLERRRDIAERNAKLLLRSALRANELSDSRDADILQLLALIQCELGMIDKAIASQQQAVALAAAEEKDHFGKVLKYYQTARELAREEEHKTPG